MKIENSFQSAVESENNNQKTIDQIYSDHAKWIKHITFQTITRHSLPWRFIDEYHAAANLGFMEALKTSKTQSKKEFRKYCFHRITGAVIDCVRKNSELSSKAYRFKREMDRLGMTEEETPRIAKKLSEDQKSRLSKILEHLREGAIVYRISLSESSEQIDALISYLDPERIYNHKERLARIIQFVGKLPSSEKFIIEQHYFKGRTYKEICFQNSGFSKGWLSKLHKRALNRLRLQFINEPENDMAA